MKFGLFYIFVLANCIVMSIISSAQEYCIKAGQINENIIYTKVQDTIPMLLWTENTAEVDLNQDGIVDFEIIRYHHQSAGNSSNYLKIRALNSNKVGTGLYFSCFTNYFWNTSYIFNEGETLNCNSIIYKDTTVIIAYYSYTNGLGNCAYNSWDQLNNSFIGVELVIDGQSYYGWIRLNTNLLSHLYKIIVYDYGISSVSDSGIIYQYEKNKVFPNPVTDELRIVNSGTIRNIRIFNIHGVCIYEKKDIHESTINMDLSFLNSGVYIIYTENINNEISYKKVIKI